MSHLSFLTRAEIEKLGPPTPEDLEETGVSDALLRNLALKQVAAITDATSGLVAEKLHLPCTLSEEILYSLYREKLIELYNGKGDEKLAQSARATLEQLRTVAKTNE